MAKRKPDWRLVAGICVALIGLAIYVILNPERMLAILQG